MTFKPLSPNILVTSLPQPQQIGAIYLPEATKTFLQKGRVEAVFDKCKTVKVGDIVGYPITAGFPTRVDDISYLIVREDQLEGVWNE